MISVSERNKSGTDLQRMANIYSFRGKLSVTYSTLRSPIGHTLR